MSKRGRGRKLARYRTVAQVLARHGFLYVVEATGLDRLIPAPLRLVRGARPDPDPGWPEHLAEALAALGPTFVKLGQLAATRSDLLPARLIAALETLQDRVPPFPGEAVDTILREAWGRPPDEVMTRESDPIGAASIGQVYAGCLRDGRRVVVKVRRPGIIDETEADFDILTAMADLLERNTPWGRQYALRELADELIRTMRDEMDFTSEGRHTDSARQNAAHADGIVVPEVIWDLTRTDVLVMTRVRGFKITGPAEVRRRGLDPDAIAARLVETMYRQIFLDGFFHADPHPGNVHVDREGRLVFLDWGMVGRLDRTTREYSVDLLLGMMTNRPEVVVDALLRLGAGGPEVDRRHLTREVERLRRRYYDTRLEQFQLGEALTDLFRVANRHHLRMPPEFGLLARAAMTLDSLVRRLNPNASLVQYGRPLVGELVWSRLNPARLGEDALTLMAAWARVARELPYGVEQLIARIESGRVHVVLEHKNLDHMLVHSEKLINRLGMSFLLSALIVGSALVVHRDSLDRLAAMPFGEYVFLAAAAMALWVIIGALRRGRL